MTPGRRTVHFQTIDDVMPDVEQLLHGHTTVGTWSLAQICNHLATVTRRVIDLPADTTHDPALLAPPGVKEQVLQSGQLPEQIPSPPTVQPPAGLDPHEEANRLRQAIAHYNASPTGPLAPHRVFGRLTKEEWDRLMLIHCAHHLSFAVPSNAT
jgi:hypothetical protein